MINMAVGCGMAAVVLLIGGWLVGREAPLVWWLFGLAALLSVIGFVGAAVGQ